MPQRRPLIERFQEKWIFIAPTGCWEWTASRDKHGYGFIGVLIDGKFKAAKTNRVSWELHKGSIPEGLCVLHKCDNPKCVNPEHLFLGTQLDNIKDRGDKNRSARQFGASNAQAKLKEREVQAIKEILRRHPSRRSRYHGIQVFLARWFGVSKSAISKIHQGRKWTHI
jgi:hypothetical protein